MKNKYEMEILLDHSFEVLYHTFNNKDKWYEELQWIMNLEEGIPMKLITQVRIYELQNERHSIVLVNVFYQLNKVYTFHNVNTTGNR